jgi:hypothetical protein
MLYETNNDERLAYKPYNPRNHPIEIKEETEPFRLMSPPLEETLS